MTGNDPHKESRQSANTRAGGSTESVQNNPKDPQKPGEKEHQTLPSKEVHNK